MKAKKSTKTEQVKSSIKRFKKCIEKRICPKCKGKLHFSYHDGSDVEGHTPETFFTCENTAEIIEKVHGVGRRQAKEMANCDFDYCIEGDPIEQGYDWAGLTRTGTIWAGIIVAVSVLCYVFK